MIHETKRPVNPLFMPIQIDNIKYDALVDTVESNNYISKSALLEIHRIKTIPNAPTKITLGGGSTTEVNESIELDFTISNLQSTVYTATFDIIKSPDSNIILGMSFLLANSCKITLEEGILTVDKQEYELNDNTVQII